MAARAFERSLTRFLSFRKGESNTGLGFLFDCRGGADFRLSFIFSEAVLERARTDVRLRAEFVVAATAIEFD